MNVLFITNLPSPYRVDFFNELGKHCQLTVCYERHTAADRNSLWKGNNAVNFREIYAKVKPYGVDKSYGAGVIDVIKSERFDELILTGYASPSVMLAIAYCRWRRIPYCIESDGAFFEKDKRPKKWIKQFLLCGASTHFTTCEEHIRYLKWIGVAETRIVKYPFTSLTDLDMKSTAVLNREEKTKIREKLGIKEERVILSVGKFANQDGYRKGYDTLLKAACDMQNVGVYIVGDEPTEAFVRMKEDLRADHVHFVGFKEKKELQNYYAAADIFVLLTRCDIWGLVVNEAMMHGLPVITTTRCNAGLEMVREGENGFLVDPEDHQSVAQGIRLLFDRPEIQQSFSRKSRMTAEKYTIEKMVDAHHEIMKD